MLAYIFKDAVNFVEDKRNCNCWHIEVRTGKKLKIELGLLENVLIMSRQLTVVVDCNADVTQSWFYLLFIPFRPLIVYSITLHVVGYLKVMNFSPSGLYVLWTVGPIPLLSGLTLNLNTCSWTYDWLIPSSNQWRF